MATLFGLVGPFSVFRANVARLKLARLASRASVESHVYDPGAECKGLSRSSDEWVAWTSRRDVRASYIVMTYRSSYADRVVCMLR